MSDEKFNRQILLFGSGGQEKLASTSIAVVGVGGLGTHVVQQLALLGVCRLVLIDPEEVDHSNRNRYVGMWHNDPIPGTHKVYIGERLAKCISPDIRVEGVPHSLLSREAFSAIRSVDYVFGCLDNEGARLVLTELCAAYEKPYFDLATEVHPDTSPSYGGRVCVALGGQGCLVCYDRIDLTEAAEDLESPTEAKQRADLYGISVEALDRSGPSVVSINGVVASLAVTEFMVFATGMREPRKLCTYRGDQTKVTVPAHDSGLPKEDCYYCKSVYGQGNEANVDRYIG